MPYAQRLADVPIDLSLSVQFDTPLLAQVINGMGAKCGSRRAIVQAIGPLLAISSEPLVSGAGSNAGSMSGFFKAQTLLKDTLDKKLSTKDA